jgi:hypothetical protein
MKPDFGNELVLRDDPDVARKQLTVAGMAHFGGTGPADTTCRQCEFWKHVGYLRATQEPEDVACDKFLRMMALTSGPRIPHGQPSCKFFSPADDPPEILKATQGEKIKQRKKLGILSPLDARAARR